MEAWLKAVHITAMVTWMAGMIVTPFLLVRRPGPEALAGLRAQFSRLTTPAMVLTLGFGLWLAQDAGWFRAAWLQAKLALVVALTALHGILSGQMRRLAVEPDRVPGPWLASIPYAVVAAVLVIAALAVVKPDLRP